jgi:hypothetical protein
VCVTRTNHDLVQSENASAASRAKLGGASFGPKICLAGFVWRNSFDGDMVCVTPWNN